MNDESIIEAFIRGFSKPLILWLIFIRPMHGYNVMREFKTVTGKSLKPADVYPFLHSMEESGYVVGSWMNESGKRRVKSYMLTKKGERLLKSIKKRISIPLGDIVFDLIKRKR